jgi:hypothetical protein
MFPSPWFPPKILAEPREDETLHQRFRQDWVDEGPVVRRQFGQRLAQSIGNGELGRHGRRESILEGSCIERRRRDVWRDGRRLQSHLVAREGGHRQAQLVGALTDTVSALLRPAALEGAVAMEGDGTGDRIVRAGTLALVFNVECVITQPPQSQVVLYR